MVLDGHCLDFYAQQMPRPHTISITTDGTVGVTGPADTPNGVHVGLHEEYSCRTVGVRDEIPLDGEPQNTWVCVRWNRRSRQLIDIKFRARSCSTHIRSSMIIAAQVSKESAS